MHTVVIPRRPKTARARTKTTKAANTRRRRPRDASTKSPPSSSGAAFRKARFSTAPSTALATPPTVEFLVLNAHEASAVPSTVSRTHTHAMGRFPNWTIEHINRQCLVLRCVAATKATATDAAPPLVAGAVYVVDVYGTPRLGKIYDPGRRSSDATLTDHECVALVTNVRYEAGSKRYRMEVRPYAPSGRTRGTTAQGSTVPVHDRPCPLLFTRATLALAHGEHLAGMVVYADATFHEVLVHDAADRKVWLRATSSRASKGEHTFVRYEVRRDRGATAIWTCQRRAIPSTHVERYTYSTAPSSSAHAHAVGTALREHVAAHAPYGQGYVAFLQVRMRVAPVVKNGAKEKTIGGAPEGERTREATDRDPRLSVGVTLPTTSSAAARATLAYLDPLPPRCSPPTSLPFAVTPLLDQTHGRRTPQRTRRRSRSHSRSRSHTRTASRSSANPVRWIPYGLQLQRDMFVPLALSMSASGGVLTTTPQEALADGAMSAAIRRTAVLPSPNDLRRVLLGNAGSSRGPTWRMPQHLVVLHLRAPHWAPRHVHSCIAYCAKGFDAMRNLRWGVDRLRATQSRWTPANRSPPPLEGPLTVLHDGRRRLRKEGQTGEKGQTGGKERRAELNRAPAVRVRVSSRDAQLLRRAWCGQLEVRVVVGNVAEEEGEDGVESPTEVESIEDETVRTAETVAQWGAMCRHFTHHHRRVHGGRWMPDRHLRNAARAYRLLVDAKGSPALLPLPLVHTVVRYGRADASGPVKMTLDPLHYHPHASARIPAGHADHFASLDGALPAIEHGVRVAHKKTAGLLVRDNGRRALLAIALLRQADWFNVAQGATDAVAPDTVRALQRHFIGAAPEADTHVFRPDVHAVLCSARGDTEILYTRRPIGGESEEDDGEEDRAGEEDERNAHVDAVVDVAAMRERVSTKDVDKATVEADKTARARFGCHPSPSSQVSTLSHALFGTLDRFYRGANDPLQRKPTRVLRLVDGERPHALRTLGVWTVPQWRRAPGAQYVARDWSCEVRMVRAGSTAAGATQLTDTHDTRDPPSTAPSRWDDGFRLEALAAAESGGKRGSSPTWSLLAVARALAHACRRARVPIRVRVEGAHAVRRDDPEEGVDAYALVFRSQAAFQLRALHSLRLFGDWHTKTAVPHLPAQTHDTQYVLRVPVRRRLERIHRSPSECTGAIPALTVRVRYALNPDPNSTTPRATFRLAIHDDAATGIPPYPAADTPWRTQRGCNQQLRYTALPTVARILAVGAVHGEVIAVRPSGIFQVRGTSVVLLRAFAAPATAAVARIKGSQVVVVWNRPHTTDTSAYTLLPPALPTSPSSKPPSKPASQRTSPLLRVVVPALAPRASAQPPPPVLDDVATWSPLAGSGTPARLRAVWTAASPSATPPTTRVVVLTIATNTRTWTQRCRWPHRAPPVGITFGGPHVLVGVDRLRRVYVWHFAHETVAEVQDAWQLAGTLRRAPSLPDAYSAPTACAIDVRERGSLVGTGRAAGNVAGLTRLGVLWGDAVGGIHGETFTLGVGRMHGARAAERALARDGSAWTACAALSEGDLLRWTWEPHPRDPPRRLCAVVHGPLPLLAVTHRRCARERLGARLRAAVAAWFGDTDGTALHTQAVAYLFGDDMNTPYHPSTPLVEHMHRELCGVGRTVLDEAQRRSLRHVQTELHVAGAATDIVHAYATRYAAALVGDHDAYQSLPVSGAAQMWADCAGHARTLRMCIDRERTSSPAVSARPAARPAARAPHQPSHRALLYFKIDRLLDARTHAQRIRGQHYLRDLYARSSAFRGKLQHCRGYCFTRFLYKLKTLRTDGSYHVQRWSDAYREAHAELPPQEVYYACRTCHTRVCRQDGAALKEYDVIGASASQGSALSGEGVGHEGRSGDATSIEMVDVLLGRHEPTAISENGPERPWSRAQLHLVASVDRWMHAMALEEMREVVHRLPVSAELRTYVLRHGPTAAKAKKKRGRAKATAGPTSEAASEASSSSSSSSSAALHTPLVSLLPHARSPSALRRLLALYVEGMHACARALDREMPRVVDFTTTPTPDPTPIPASAAVLWPTYLARALAGTGAATTLATDIPPRPHYRPMLLPAPAATSPGWRAVYRALDPTSARAVATAPPPFDQHSRQTTSVYYRHNDIYLPVNRVLTNEDAYTSFARIVGSVAASARAQGDRSHAARAALAKVPRVRLAQRLPPRRGVSPGVRYAPSAYLPHPTTPGPHQRQRSASLRSATHTAARLLRRTVSDPARRVHIAQTQLATAYAHAPCRLPYPLRLLLQQKPTASVVKTPELQLQVLYGIYRGPILSRNPATLLHAYAAPWVAYYFAHAHAEPNTSASTNARNLVHSVTHAYGHQFRTAPVAVQYGRFFAAEA